MILESILEPIFAVITRLLGWIFIELIAHIIFYFTGYTAIKIVTLGKHPVKTRSEHLEQKRASNIILLGLVVWLGVLACVVAFNWT